MKSFDAYDTWQKDMIAFFIIVIYSIISAISAGVWEYNYPDPQRIAVQRVVIGLGCPITIPAMLIDLPNAF